MDNHYVSLAVALAERGVTTPAAFRAHFGVFPNEISTECAFILAQTPAWVMDVWLPNVGKTSVVYVPHSVRLFATALGVTQETDETPHQFTLRIQRSLSAISTGSSR